MLATVKTKREGPWVASTSTGASQGSTLQPSWTSSDLYLTQLKCNFRVETGGNRFYSAFSFSLIKHCWEEKPQFRPSFSSLVVSVGNMLTDDYKKVPEFFTFFTLLNLFRTKPLGLDSVTVVCASALPTAEWELPERWTASYHSIPSCWRSKSTGREERSVHMNSHLISTDPFIHVFKFRSDIFTMCCLQKVPPLRWMFTCQRRRTGGRQALPMALT